MTLSARRPANMADGAYGMSSADAFRSRKHTGGGDACCRWKNEEKKDMFFWRKNEK